ncbi:MAG: stage III sporulation protein AF [Eubacteriaceae bacterium]|nr:stage III sporulation protein AF [Eubacteriaceae bacterium]
MSIILIGYITPEGKYEKQIKLAVSVLFVAAIFIPIVELIKGSDYNEVFYQTALSIDSHALSVSEGSINNAYKQNIVAAYKADLESALKTRLESKISYEGSVTITVDDDLASPTFGEIVSVEAEADSEPESVMKIIKEFYSVDEENIYITDSEGNYE